MPSSSFFFYTLFAHFTFYNLSQYALTFFFSPITWQKETKTSGRTSWKLIPGTRVFVVRQVSPEIRKSVYSRRRNGVKNIPCVPTVLAGLLLSTNWFNTVHRPLLPILLSVLNYGPSRGDDRGLTDEDAERRLERRRLPTRRRCIYTLRSSVHVYTLHVWSYVDRDACGYCMCNRNTQHGIPTIISTQNVARLLNRAEDALLTFLVWISIRHCERRSYCTLS